MAEKKRKEDNRDIFDKALDNAPVIGGAILGGLGARSILRKMNGGKYATRAMKREANQLAIISGAPTGALVGAMVSDGPKNKKRRK
jgi:hypothetical protein